MVNPSSAVEGRWSASLRAVVMFTLLIASLAMATWISELRRPAPPLTLAAEMHGPLTLSTPEGWISGPADAPPAMLRDAVALRSPDNDQQLLIGRLPDAPARSPLRALDEAYRLLVDPADPLGHAPTPIARLRIGPILGAQRLSLQASTDGAPQKHLLAVLTLEGRQYWIVRLSGRLRAAPTDVQAVNRELVFDRRLFESILESASLANLRPATDADFQAVGLRPVSIEGYDFWIDPSQLPDAPLIVLPADGHAYLQVLRLRAEVEGLPDSDRDPFSPPQLMARRFESMFGRPPDQSQLMLGEVADMTVLRLRLGIDPATGFFRELWYVTPHGHALLLELAAEGPPQVGQGLVGLVREFQRLEYPPETVRSDWNPEQQRAEMLERGRKLVAGQLRLAPSMVDQQQPEARLLVHDQWPVAWELARHQLDSDPGDKMIRWDAAGMFGSILRYRITASMAADGSSFSQQTLLQAQTPEGQPPRVNQTMLMLRDGVLSYDSREVGAGQGESAGPSWRMPAPDPLVVPLIDTVWPLDELANQTGPALAWMSLGFLRPAPCRIHLVPAEQSAQGQPVLVVRPVMAMDPALMLLDSQGQAVRYQWLWDSADPGLADRRYTTSRVALQTLLDAFPQAGPAIEQAQEELSHEP